MSKKKKCENCNWTSYKGKSKKIREQCLDCKDVFPCREVCGHVDCAEHKSAKCYSCGRSLSGSEHSMVAGSGSRCYFVHIGCVGENEVLWRINFENEKL